MFRGSHGAGGRCRAFRRNNGCRVLYSRRRRFRGDAIPIATGCECSKDYADRYERRRLLFRLWSWYFLFNWCGHNRTFGREILLRHLLRVDRVGSRRAPRRLWCPCFGFNGLYCRRARLSDALSFLLRLSVRRSRACGIIRRRCRRHRFGASGVLVTTCLAPIAVEAGSGTARATKIGRPVRTRSPIEVAVLLVR